MGNIRKILFINILFYILLSFDKYVVLRFGFDYITQVLFYIILFSSSIVLEESVRKKRINLTIISGIDFMTRVTFVVYHLITIITGNYKYYYVILAATLFLTLFLEVCMLIVFKRSTFKEVSDVSNKEIGDFIEEFTLNKRTFSLTSEQINYTKSLIKMIKEMGKENIKAGCMFFSLFFLTVSATRISFNIALIVSIILGIVFVYSTLLTHYSTMKAMFNKEKLMIRFTIDVVCLVLGLATLYISEFYVKVYFEFFRVSFWMMAIVFFIPYINLRNSLRNELKGIIRIDKAE